MVAPRTFLPFSSRCHESHRYISYRLDEDDLLITVNDPDRFAASSVRNGVIRCRETGMRRVRRVAATANAPLESRFNRETLIVAAFREPAASDPVFGRN